MTPERITYFNSMSQEEFDNRVMVLYHKSSITLWKKKLNILVTKIPVHLDSLRLCEVMIRLHKKKLVRAKKKLPNRKAQ